MLELSKRAIDLGIVVRNTDACRQFYGDLLGFEFEGAVDMPGGAKMYRYLCGDTVIKLVAMAQTPAASNPANGLMGGSGLRYFTIVVNNLEAAHQACVDAAVPIAISPRESRPGVRICIVEDPDGNWVEFVQYA